MKSTGLKEYLYYLFVMNESILPRKFVTISSHWKNYNALADAQNRFNFAYEDRVRMDYVGCLTFWKIDSILVSSTASS